jgi:hypothetical protein
MGGCLPAPCAKGGKGRGRNAPRPRRVSRTQKDFLTTLSALAIVAALIPWEEYGAFIRT